MRFLHLFHDLILLFQCLIKCMKLLPEIFDRFLTRRNLGLDLTLLLLQLDHFRFLILLSLLERRQSVLSELQLLFLKLNSISERRKVNELPESMKGKILTGVLSAQSVDQIDFVLDSPLLPL